MTEKQDRRPQINPEGRARLKRLDRQVSDIGVGDAYLDALEESRTDETALAKVKADPKAYFEGKGVRFPDEVEVEYKEGDSYSYCCHYYLYNRWGSRIGLVRRCVYYY